MRAVLSVAILLTIAYLTTAQNLPRTRPETVGMSAERLDRFSSIASNYVREARVAGVVALVVRQGRVVYELAHGEMDVNSREPMRSNTIFRIASMTKPITSVAAMILVEEGRLNLDDSVGRYIPAFEQAIVSVDDGDSSVPAARPITIQNLLTHTAGIANLDGLKGKLRQRYEETLGRTPFNAQDASIRALVDRLAKLPLASQPGERFTYGYATDVLGAVIEEVSGLSLEQFLESRLFTPLKMHDTHFFLPEAKKGRLASVHNPREGGGIVRGGDDDLNWTGQGAFVHGPRRAFSGGGGLVSTANDYARFLQMLLNGGELEGARILSSSSVRLMTVNHVRDLYAKAEKFPGMGMGLGFEVKIDAAVGGYDVPQLASTGSFAWGGAAYTTFWVDPEQQILGIFLAQLRPYKHLDLNKRFGNIVYGAILAPPR